MSVGYDRFGLDSNQFASETGLGASGASISMVSLMSGLRVRFIPQGFTPYVGFNAGLVHASIDDLTVTDGVSSQEFFGYSENALGISLGGGVEGMVSERASAFTELRITTAFTDGESQTFIPVRGGMRMHF
jgi:opacity protein-like surface antigen